MTQIEPAVLSPKKSRASAACISCRNKHLRCDGKRPDCGRCLTDGTQCQYVKSRRGGRSKAQLEARRDCSASQTHMSSAELHLQSGEAPDVWLDNYPVSQSETSSSTQVDGCLEGQLDAQPLGLTKCTFLDHYYRYFHNPHPCVLPRQYFQKRYELAATRKRMGPLISVMRYVGSLFTKSKLSPQLRQLAEKAISEAQIERPDPFMVQCHLIYSIVRFWCCDPVQSREHMHIAIRTALDLGMSRRQFAKENGEDDAVLEESWRRTWWQVYIIDAFYAAINREAAFLTHELEVSVGLPCEEQDYEAGVIPPPKTLEDFEDREFFHEPHVYSSFAYLISATRCCVSAMAIVHVDISRWNSSQILAEADAIMEAWQLLLPESKREILAKDGQVDELMFQAQMILNTTTIVFHRPFSELLFNPLESLSTCSNGPPPSLPVQESVVVHTMHCLKAIEAQVRLIALPSQPLQHTPFTICMINESAIPLLSACKFLFTGQKLSIARSQLRLMIGSLKRTAKTWPRAARNMQELQAIAREVLIPMPRDETGIPSEEVSQSNDGDGVVQVVDPCPLGNWGDLSISDASLANFDAVWGPDVQAEMPRWFDYA